MTEQERLYIKDNNMLLRVKSGSCLYGLATPESDIDILGVVAEPIRYKCGFSKFNEIDFSIKDKLDNGRNSKDAVDEKYYSLSRFVSLLFDNNPTILELLFADLSDADDIIKELHANRHHFLTARKVKDAFIGYATAQERKLEVKSDNIEALTMFYDRIKHIVVDGASSLKDILNREEYLKDVLDEYKADQLDIIALRDKSNSKNEIKALNNKLEKISFGTRQFSVNMLFKKFIEQVENTIKSKLNRAELVEVYGYDTKFASHYLRLLVEGIELLETGSITFPLKDRDFLLDVKKGKYSLDEILSFGVEYREKIADIKPVITNSVNHDAIEELVIEFYKDKFGFNWFGKKIFKNIKKLILKYINKSHF